jgi:hypothetical protein
MSEGFDSQVSVARGEQAAGPPAVSPRAVRANETPFGVPFGNVRPLMRELDGSGASSAAIAAMLLAGYTVVTGRLQRPYGAFKKSQIAMDTTIRGMIGPLA